MNTLHIASGTPPIVFFSRCRPQQADPIEIVRREKRVFIGYPAWRRDRPYRSGHIRDSIVDPSCTEDEWRAGMEVVKEPTHRRFYNQNRNFVAKVAPGSLALVPRPSLGVVFVGRVKGRFELVNDPHWAQDYLDLRVKQGKWINDEPGTSHVGDVAQSWEVDCFRPIPVPAIPAWIRRSLFGRSTYGIVQAPGVPGLDPYRALDNLIEQPEQAVRDWVSDLDEVERRLLNDVTPSAFEHLCVALMQLERPTEVWAHVGGSGDGGVDGIGANASGRVTSLLQCKWSYKGGEVEFATPWGSSGGDEHRRVLASLLHPRNPALPDGVEFWSRRFVAELVLRHAHRLPSALSLRVR